MRYTIVPRFAFIAATIAALAVPSPAHAQFGKLLKKAKQAVAPGAADKTSSNGTPVQYSDTTLELTSSRVANLVLGLRAKLRLLSTADGIGVEAMNERAEKLKQQFPTVDPREEPTYDQAVSDHKFCMEKTLDTLDRSHAGDAEAATMAIAMDRTKAMEMGAKMQQAQQARQRGDTATANRLQREMIAPLAGIQRKDSVEAMKRCGAAPVKPADLAKLDSLRAVQQRQIDRIRVVLGQADSAAAQRSGMTRRQFDVAKERVLAYLAPNKNKNGLGKTELAALDARHDEIQRLAEAIHTQGAGW